MGGDGRSAIEVVGGLGVEEGGDQGTVFTQIYHPGKSVDERFII